MKIVNFPLESSRQLTFDQASLHVTLRNPPASFGLIAGYDENDKIFIITFGNISRKDALWLSEQLKRHSQGEEIS